MASRTVAYTALLLSLNLLFFTLVSSSSCPPPSPKPKGPSPQPSNPSPKPKTPAPSNPSPKPKLPSPQPSNPSPKPKTPAPSNPSPKPKLPSPKPSNPSPKPSNPSPTPSNGACPRDTLKLGVCVDLLKGLLGITIGSPPTTPCCSLLTDLVDLEAAVCLCTTIKASVLGININLPIDLSLLLNSCGRKVPEGFKCA
ncbi:hypothetical protein P3X46_029860 [Hevea brasiliensis]|uniref:Bifunctional inhibitor/plant lipid transfer protein/seed storage helical domain-containing protein n=1 Tax=Hevea brasiliensis TaxID=3981 RepID=A0ABQ9KUY5_HEVBR|nr:lipid transfer protein EARLI 1-like [Hevea brasiliensis]KAJ9147734.1 hypothetical protein P3X46_029860 [Hevea brasiliensis]